MMGAKCPPLSLSVSLALQGEHTSVVCSLNWLQHKLIGFIKHVLHLHLKRAGDEGNLAHTAYPSLNTKQNIQPLMHQ